MDWTRIGASGALLIGACATTSPEQRAYYDDQARRLGTQPVAIVADSCIVRDEVGEDLVLREISESLGRQSADALAAELRRRGQSVAAVHVPFLCGFVGKNSNVTLIAANRDAPRETARLPVVLTASDERGESTEAALLALIHQATESAPTTTQRGSPKATALTIDDATQAELRRALGVDRVWVLHYGGVEISTGKQIGTAVLTGILTLGITGGSAYAASMPVGGNGYNLALVDLATRQIVWKKRQPAAYGPDGAIPPEWASTAFEPFYPVEQTGASMVASTTPAAAPANAPARPTPAPTAIAAPTPPPAIAIAAPPMPSAPAPMTAAPASTKSAAQAALPTAAAPVAVATTTVAATASNSLRLLHATPMRVAPVPTAAIARILETGDSVVVASSIHNANGTWLYVKAEDGPGWINSP